MLTLHPTLYVIAVWLAYFFIYALLGWIYESTFVSVEQKRLVNRGFLSGPIIPIYGVGAVLAVALLTPISQHIILVYICSALGAAILEYSTSWVMEQLFHARWWDYSNEPLNLHGRIYALGITFFAFCGTLVTCVLHPWIAQFVASISPIWLTGCVIVLLLLTCADCISTVIGIMHWSQDLETIKQQILEYASKAGKSLPLNATTRAQEAKESIQRALEEWSLSSKESFLQVKESVMHVVNHQQKRLLDAFPKLQVLDKESVVESVRALLNNRDKR